MIGNLYSPGNGSPNSGLQLWHATARIGRAALKETRVMLRTKIVPFAMAAVIALGRAVGVAHAANNNRVDAQAQSPGPNTLTKLQLAQKSNSSVKKANRN